MVDKGEVQDSQSRPFGVYAILLLLLIQMVLMFTDLLGNDFLKLPPIAQSYLDNRQLLILTRGLFALVIISIMVGLWRLKRKAWYATMFLLGAFLIWNIWLYFQNDAVYANLLIGIIVVFYLNLHDVQEAFGTK